MSDKEGMALKKEISKAKSSPKRYRVTDFFLPQAISWPGHFQGAQSLNDSKVKGLKMMLPNLEGWILMNHKGQLGATNGVCVVSLEALDSAEE